MFEKAKVNWRYFEKDGDTKTALVVGVLVTDSVYGEKDFKTKIIGDELQEILTSQNPSQKGMQVIKQKLKPRYQEWIASQQDAKSVEAIPGSPEFTSLN